MNTHYAVLAFSGDLDGEHPDPDLNGTGPSLTLIAAGPEDFCWQALADWTANHPLRIGEDAEVVERHLSVVQAAQPARCVGACTRDVDHDGKPLSDCRGCYQDMPEENTDV